MIPIKCDIRNETEVENVVKEVDKIFGKVDILISNASAIKLVDTQTLKMKEWDLMQTVNARGTFMVIKLFVPLLLKGSNPHVITNSPPLSLNPKWYAGHMAYT